MGLSQCAPTQLLNPWPWYFGCVILASAEYSLKSQPNDFRNDILPQIMAGQIIVIITNFLPIPKWLYYLFYLTVPKPSNILYSLNYKILCSQTVVYIRNILWLHERLVCVIRGNLPRLYPITLSWFSPLWCHNSPLDACPFDLCIHVRAWKEKQDMVIFSWFHTQVAASNDTNEILGSWTLRLLPEERQRIYPTLLYSKSCR